MKLAGTSCSCYPSPVAEISPEVRSQECTQVMHVYTERSSALYQMGLKTQKWAGCSLLFRCSCLCPWNAQKRSGCSCSEGEGWSGNSVLLLNLRTAEIIGDWWGGAGRCLKAVQQETKRGWRQWGGQGTSYILVFTGIQLINALLDSFNLLWFQFIFHLSSACSEASLLTGRHPWVRLMIPGLLPIQPRCGCWVLILLQGDLSFGAFHVLFSLNSLILKGRFQLFHV